MNKYKQRLIILIGIQAILTIIHIILDKPATNPETWVEEAGWHYWTGMVFGIFVVLYALSLNCKNCGSRQVFRTMTIYGLRWPQDNCWKCGRKIE